MLTGLECDIIVEYRERLTRFDYAIVEMPYGRRGTKNRAQHAIEDISYGIDEEARWEHEHEASEKEEGVEETQQAR